MIDAQRLDTDLAEPGMTHRAQGDAEANRRIAVRLDEIEAAHDFVLLLGDTTPTAWTHRCSRHCDELYLLADADRPARLHPIEDQCLVRRPARTDAAEILVLLHPADRRSPRGTEAWLARRDVADHLHIRPALERDIGRLARLISRTGVGLVLAGGGARGLAHLGVYRALQERGIEIDVVGGTSIGAVMAAYVAADRPIDDITANARQAFATNPTGDFNLIPMVSLIKGLRLRRIVGQALRAQTGFEARVEDLWKSYYCVVTNYSQAREQVVRRGPLLDALLASSAIPGALPPLISEGDLLCDGGTFNNFPVDVMRGMRGVGRVIGVDLSFRNPLPDSARRGARHLGAAARPPAAAPPAALQAADAAGLPDERHRAVQHVAPARGAQADRRLHEPAAAPRRHAAVGALRPDRRAGVCACLRGAGRGGVRGAGGAGVVRSAAGQPFRL